MYLNASFLFRHIITAAHCLQKNYLSGDIEFIFDNITIILGKYSFSHHLNMYFKRENVHCSGEHDISDEHEAETIITKAISWKTQIHRKFYIRLAQGTIKYDVAILEMENPVNFTDHRLRHIR